MQRVAAVVRSLRPDVIALQEVRRVRPFLDQARELAERLGMHAVFQANLKRGWRFRFGNAVLTRAAEYSVERVPLPGGGEPRGLLLLRLDLEGDEIAFGSTHLGLQEDWRAAQKTAILDALPADLPTVLCGDFNEAPHDLGELASRLTLAEPQLTFPAQLPSAAIDFVLVSERWRVDHVRAVPTHASDHLPVVADLVLA